MYNYTQEDIDKSVSILSEFAKEQTKDIMYETKLGIPNK